MAQPTTHIYNSRYGKGDLALEGVVPTMTQEMLATKLRVLRAERGLSLRQASKLTGVDIHTLSNTEKGKHVPWDQTLAKIARGYGVPVSDLIGDTRVPLPA